MTREEVLRWAEEADLYQDGKFFVCDADELVRFAALVAAAEREACANLCESEARMHDHGDVTGRGAGGDRADVARTCAAVIRQAG